MKKKIEKWVVLKIELIKINVKLETKKEVEVLTVTYATSAALSKCNIQ